MASENEKYATAIDTANIGKLVHYHQNGWRIGTLEAVTAETVQVKAITDGHPKSFCHHDVRLVLREVEKPKAETSGKPEKAKSAKLPVPARKQRAKAAAAKLTKKARAAKKSKAPKTYDVHFNVDRIVKLYDRGKGKNVSEIAQAIGYPKGHGNNRVANALITAGVYKGTRTTQ